MWVRAFSPAVTTQPLGDRSQSLFSAESIHEK
jgi:hypothetical protein